MKSFTIYLVVFFLAIIPSVGVAQQLSIIDYASKQPVSGVHIFNLTESKSVISDSNGFADIAIFQDDEFIVFSHTSYIQVLFKKQDLYSSHYVLELRPTILNLDEFVFSANKRIQAKEEVPNKLVSITSKDIKLLDPQTAADMIASTGQVFVQKSQLGGGSPMIRGFSANKVLIVVDGVRMNNAIFRGGNLQNVISIDPNCIEKSEIVFGPGSVIYGSDALGGVMDFKTISSSFSDSGIQVNGNAMFRYSSANNEITPHVDFSIAGKKWNFVSSISYSKFSDLVMGTNGPEEYKRSFYVSSNNGIDELIQNPNPEKQVSSGYSSINLLQKVGYKWNENVNLTYKFLYSNTTDIPRYDRLLQTTGDSDSLKYAVWNYGPQKWMMNQLSLNINSPNGLYDNLRVTLALQNFEESRIDRKFNSALTRTKTENVNMASINVDFDNAISGRSTLYYGLESVYNVVYSKAISMANGFSVNSQTRYPNNSKYYSNSAYLNFQVNYSKKTTMVYGMRYNAIKIDAILDTTFYKSYETATINQTTGALTGSLGIAHRPTDGLQLNMNFSSGFKAPNIDDIAKVFDSQKGNVIVPNPDLKPEYLYAIDGLVEKYWGSHKKYRVEISGYYSFLVDAMVQRDSQVNGQDSIIYDGELSQVQTMVNTGSAVLTGVGVGFDTKLYKQLTFTSYFTYTYGVDNEGNNLRHVTPVFANAHLIYSFKKLRVDGYVNYNGKLANDKMAPTELKKPEIYMEDTSGGLYAPSWYTVNVKSSVVVSEKLLFTLGVENITNQRYRAYSSGITAPGINFIGSIKATF
jgi:hemoglobin/transferrin/lactoferrin receptor protein